MRPHNSSKKDIAPCALTCSGNFLSCTQSWRDRKAKCEKQYVRETILTIRPPHNFVMWVVKIYCINKCWTKWNWTKWSFWDTHRLKNLPEVQHRFLFLPLLLMLSVPGIAPLSISSILWVWLCCRSRGALPAPHIPGSVIPCANPKCYAFMKCSQGGKRDSSCAHADVCSQPDFCATFTCPYSCQIKLFCIKIPKSKVFSKPPG